VKDNFPAESIQMTLWRYTTQLALTKYTNFLIHKNHKFFALGKNLTNLKNSDLVTTTKAREGKLSIKLQKLSVLL